MRFTFCNYCALAHSRVFGHKSRWWAEEEALKYLEGFKLQRKDLLASKKDLTTDFEVLKTEIGILEEFGAVIDLENLKRFRKLFREDLTTLKGEGVLHDTDVEEKLLKYFEEFPYDPKVPFPSVEGIEEVYKKIKQYHRKSINMQDAVKDWPKNVKEETMRTLEIAQRRVLRQYYVWRLASDFFTIDKLMYNYSKITGIRTVRSLRKTLDILEKDLELPKSKILRNFFLLSIVPERLEDVITNVEKIGGNDLKTAVQAVPKILAKSSAQIKEIEQTLYDYGITDEFSASPYRNQVFTYTPATVRQRLQAIKDNSNLEPFLKHPRICELIFYFRKAWARAKDVESRGFKCCSLNLLTANEKIYESFINEGVDRVHAIKDVIHYIAHTLKVPKESFSKYISRHHMRFFIPASEVKLTLEALIEAGISKEVIAESVTIVLYPKYKVLEALDAISDSDELMNLGLAKGFSPPTDTFPSGSKHSDKRLSLCLYLLEKPYHFTGEGVTRLNGDNDYPD